MLSPNSNEFFDCIILPESLRLADNGLTGEIPLSLYSLTNLRTL